MCIRDSVRSALRQDAVILPRASHLTASLREQPAQAPVPPLHHIFGASDQLGAMPQGIRTGIESLRQEARLAGPALCQLLCNSAVEPTQASTTRPVRSPSHASLLSIFQSRALHLTSIAPRAARACLGTVSSPLFWCFRPARNYAPGQAYWNRDGIISDQDSPFCRFDEGPTGPRANLRQESGRSSRDCGLCHLSIS